MKLNYNNRTIDVFSVFPRIHDQATYIKNLEDFSSWDDKYGTSGMLLFVGNDTVLDQWLSVFKYLSNSTTPSPLIAVNPSYMHPFSLARMINSASSMFNRKIYLNLITGAGGSAALGDKFEHDKRYERLIEYITCVKMLLDQSQLVNFDGEFYQLNNLQLRPALPEHLQPELFVAGHSPAAIASAQKVGARHMTMLKSTKGDVEQQGAALHFGMFTRESTEGAWQAANDTFQEDFEGQMILDYSMQFTDSQWKHGLHQKQACEDGYWLTPFKNNLSDCPYVVKSHQDMAEMIVELTIAGASAFVIEIPATEQEFEQTSKAFALAQQLLDCKN